MPPGSDTRRRCRLQFEQPLATAHRRRRRRDRGRPRCVGAFPPRHRSPAPVPTHRRRREAGQRESHGPAQVDAMRAVPPKRRRPRAGAATDSRHRPRRGRRSADPGSVRRWPAPAGDRRPRPECSPRGRANPPPTPWDGLGARLEPWLAATNRAKPKHCMQRRGFELMLGNTRNPGRNGSTLPPQKKNTNECRVSTSSP